ncbi:glyoxalase [Streptomyces sp. WAC 01529]|uniref:VOC family protein n=1 Tax=Streptomyces sp. WAC 01529 TaxID=2203205 RepID=UPI000F6F58D1|nr:VOC family protein [Streptomyces sp. WAC 01529]AZM53356.1 glyoxalase [Streptomyces sp. WAC 01529]
MTLEWEQVVIDATDPEALGRWWAEALGWTVVESSDDEYEIRPEPGRLPSLLFGRSPEKKTEVKNRVHLDFRPDDRDAEVARLLAHGARHADVGQSGDEPWVVLLDPEGNEFCVLGPRHG